MIIRYFFPLTVNNTARNIVRCLAKDDINGALILLQTFLGTVPYDVAGFSRQVLRCLAATDGIVECRTAVTGTGDDGLTGMVAQGLENVLAQCLEVPYYGLVCFTEGLRLLLMPLARRGRGGMV